MLITLAVLLFLLVYGSHRCVTEKSFSFFQWLGSMVTHTFFKADRAVAVVLWGTVAATVIGASLLGAKGFNTSHFDAPMHFLFGFLARELIKNANDYHPFVDNFSDRFPGRMARFITPGTFAIALCLANGIQEELQKTIPMLGSIMYTDFREQVIDIVMDLAGVTFSANRSSLRALLRRRPREEQIGLSTKQVHREEYTGDYLPKDRQGQT